MSDEIFHIIDDDEEDDEVIYTFKQPSDGCLPLVLLLGGGALAVLAELVRWFA